MTAAAYDSVLDWIGNVYCRVHRIPDDCYENRVRAEMGLPEVKTAQPKEDYL